MPDDRAGPRRCLVNKSAGDPFSVRSATSESQAGLARGRGRGPDEDGHGDGMGWDGTARDIAQPCGRPLPSGSSPVVTIHGGMSTAPRNSAGSRGLRLDGILQTFRLRVVTGQDGPPNDLVILTEWSSFQYCNKSQAEWPEISGTPVRSTALRSSPPDE